MGRFEDEARAAAALNRANMLSIYDVGTENGVAFMVSGLIDGPTLRRPARRRRRTMVLGTAGDMSLEQVKGLPADHRAPRTDCVGSA